VLVVPLALFGSCWRTWVGPLWLPFESALGLCPLAWMISAARPGLLLGCCLPPSTCACTDAAHLLA